MCVHGFNSQERCPGDCRLLWCGWQHIFALPNLHAWPPALEGFPVGLGGEFSLPDPFTPQPLCQQGSWLLPAEMMGLWLAFQH